MLHFNHQCLLLLLLSWHDDILLQLLMIGLFWSLDTDLQCLRQPNDGGAEVDKNYGVIIRLNTSY